MQMTTFTAKFSLPFNAITEHKATNRMYNKNSKAFHFPFCPSCSRLPTKLKVLCRVMRRKNY